MPFFDDVFDDEVDTDRCAECGRRIASGAYCPDCRARFREEEIR